MSDWLRALQRLGDRGLDGVLVTVVSGKGSTPREAGAKMVVAIDATHGTIGGGELEFQAIDVARGMLHATGDRQARRFPLGASLGQYCGGAANLIFERVPAGVEWVSVLAAWHDAGEACVVVTPTSGDDGGRLLVRAGERWGSLREAAWDTRGTDLARRMLADLDRAPRLAPLDDAASALLEPLPAADFDIALFGAGHVGRALVRVLSALPCRVTWTDSRAEEFPREVPDNVRVALTATPVAEVAAAGPGSYFLVITHSHALDLELVEAILKRGDFAYCGMIGSQTKRRTFENGLAKRGVSAAGLARLTCPIGIPGIKGKEPGAIAVAVAAQLLEHRERAAAVRDLKAAADA